MRKPVRLALAFFALIASFKAVQHTGTDFAISWLVILFGLDLSPASIAEALAYSVVVGLAVAVLVISALDIVHTIEAIATRKA